jgi:hypothetical protein
MSTLTLPIDASQIPEQDRKQHRVRVAVQQGGKVRSSVVSLEGGKAEVKLDIDPKQPASIAVGPESATDEDIFHFQTLTASVSPNQWAGRDQLSLAPIAVTLPWWTLWRRWCREFVINGTLRCADGSPVPGAEVRAYDVDFFWWWSSVLPVGPAAVTDSSGHFTIKFRWCCGWWPWWWWRLREWRLEPLLVDKIQPVLRLNPDLRFPEPSPVPSLDFSTLMSRQPPMDIGRPPLPKLSPALAVGRQIDPSVLPALRDRLTTVLPHVPELERLRIWPWIPWTPWLDCTPDIIFRATQSCGGAQPKVILSETIFQTRWDIPTSLNVNLVANQDACCLPSNPSDPPGDCFVFTGVCGDPGIPVTSIGRTGATAGYADPGGRDRPFAETVYLSGQFGSSAQADYYEIEYTPHGVNAWAPLPAAALLGMTRGYFDSTQPWPNQWFYPGFPVKSFGTKNVYESRHFYEATHPPANWGSALTGRSWFYNVNQVASIQTAGILPDGAYDFRVIGYKALPNGDLDPATRKVMDGCGGHQDNNLLVLRFDNRLVGPATPGTVHVNTTEPDCGINAVRLGPVPGGVLVAPCGSQQLKPGTPLEIDFFVTDPDGHLDHYELVVKYDLGSIKNLLSAAEVGSFTLVPPPGGSAGPDYSNAVPPLPRPIWTGGSMKLVIDDASKVFPKTCCYLIELTVWKRNIANCDGHLAYYNQMHYSFTILV